MRKLVLRPAAETDLEEIYRYIAEQSGSRDQAIGYIRRIREWCNHLLIFPEAGRSRNDLRPGVRITTYERRVVIAYMVLPSGDIEIAACFTGAAITRPLSRMSSTDLCAAYAADHSSENSTALV